MVLSFARVYVHWDEICVDGGSILRPRSEALILARKPGGHFPLVRLPSTAEFSTQASATRRKGWNSTRTWSRASLRRNIDHIPVRCWKSAHTALASFEQLTGDLSSSSAPDVIPLSVSLTTFSLEKTRLTRRLRTWKAPSLDRRVRDVESEPTRLQRCWIQDERQVQDFWSSYLIKFSYFNFFFLLLRL